MYCKKCNKDHAGYRCPYCGDFLLDDPAIKGKNFSVYHKETVSAGRKMWPVYLFLIAFVGAWLFVIIYFIR